MKTHQGSCHCGAVTYDVTADITSALRCNCSHCQRKGLLLTFTPESSFTLKSGEGDLIKYNFNKHLIDHVFCKTCGVQSFAHGQDGEGNKMVAINVNCLENFDIDSIEIQKYDGRSS